MPDSFQNSELVKQLDKLARGRLPEPVFEAIARLVATPTFVVIPVFRRADRTRIVLTRRAADDSQYAGMLHAPGKILLATDNDLDAVYARLVATELSEITIRSAPVFVAHFFEQITRGREISLVHYLEVDDPAESVLSFDPSALPKDVVQTDVARIIAAVEAYDQASLM
ncbi:MAG: hypothetical protein QNJ20_00640 [Paracoccaceae bacterium]|nr:hypothetical protein [Paracoccaceae bacterium]